jgi:23S rRNA (uracil1939-C5)-methyltransferase
MNAVTIERIAAGGDGVGRLADGMTVFVPRTAPGDEVDLEIVDRKPRFARARVRQRSASGAERVEPPCPHYREDACGGCQLQHLAPAAQLEAKRRIVGDALRRIARREVDDPAIVPAPEAWRYRTRATLAARQGRVGFHRFDDPGHVFDLKDCPITREGVMHLWGRVRGQMRALPDSLSGVTLRQDRDGGLHLMVETPDQTAWDATPLMEALGEPRCSIWWRPGRGAARVVAGEERGFPVVAFEQVYPEFGERIRRDAVDALGNVDGEVVWDLYGGVGDTAELLAQRGARAWTVDADRRAVEWGRDRQQVGAGTGTVERIAGRVEESLHRLPRPAAAVVNPPRGGIAKAVAAALDQWAAGLREARVSYVSCDPATLARDLARMPSLRLATLTAYDLFPQTSHVEMLAVLEAA